MQQGHYVFSQVMAHLPLTTFRRCVARYRGEHKIKRFSCPMGAVPLQQGCHQAPYAARSARQYPLVLFISDGKMHDVNILDQLLPEPGAFYVMDRGYMAFERLARFEDAGGRSSRATMLLPTGWPAPYPQP